MYNINDILELIKRNPEEEFIVLKDVIEIPFAEVVYCHGYDELIDILDEAFCESYIPKFDCSYEIEEIDEGSFYHGDIKFNISISVDVKEFLNEYREE